MILNFALPPTGLYVLAVAIAMYACAKAWNHAEHCQARKKAAALGGLFWMLAATVIYGGYKIL